MKKTQKFVDKSYKLSRGRAPLAYMLSSHHTKRTNLLYFDEETGSNRPLRYSRNQKSPFEDEQDGNVIMEPIIFEDGLLHVSKQNQVLQHFLALHPGNGNIFVEINSAKDAHQELEVENIVLEAQLIARDLSVEKLVTISRVLLGTDIDKMSTAELKRDMLVFARQNPVDFLDILDDPALQVQDDVVLFFQNSLLTLKNKQRDVYFNLLNNKKKFLTVPFGEDPMDIVASYCQTDDGIETYKLLKRKLKGEAPKFEIENDIKEVKIDLEPKKKKKASKE
tara:strand:- start:32316 stop:33152 length:837 start_codon:yes stop_codon:yes gene_type:complete